MNAERWYRLIIVLLSSASLPLWVMSVGPLTPSSSAFAAQITLAWDGTHDPAVAGYILYYRSANGQDEGAIDVGLQDTYTLTDLKDGESYYFAVTAYDVDGNESEASEEIVHDPAMGNAEADAEEPSLFDGEEANTEAADGPYEEVTQSWHAGGEDQALSDQVESDQDAPPEAGLADDVLPYSQLSIVYVDSEPLAGEGAAEDAIDGRPETFWRTDMGARAPGHPHELVIALGGSYNVRGIRYLPRQDGSLDGTIERFRLYVSEDGVEWGTAVAAGSFARDATEKEVIFPERMGNFVRLVAHSEVNGMPWTSIAEISILVTP